MSTKGFFEYVNEMSNERPGYRSLIKNLLSHRLKIKYVQGRDVPHWETEIKTWEDDLVDLLTTVKPSLKSVQIDLHDLYAKVLKQKDGLRRKYPKASFPDTCPYASLKEVLGSRVWNARNRRSGE